MKVKTQSKKVNKAWLNDHVNDTYVKLAKVEGFRARAAYKLKEIDETLKLIKKIEYGTNNSPEQLNQGLTHCFLLTFKSEADRDAYLIHPIHKEFGKLVGPQLDKVTVFDYWAKK